MKKPRAKKPALRKPVTRYIGGFAVCVSEENVFIDGNLFSPEQARAVAKALIRMADYLERKK
jgi:hypothetical protein